MTVKERISEYQSLKGYSDFAFERAIGKSRGAWRKTENPTSEMLMLIFTTFPDLSSEYVFRGEGEMLKQDSSAANNATVNYYENIIKVKNERIDQLERELAKLRVICEEQK